MSAFIKEAFEPVFILCLPEFISIIYSLEITELVLGEKRLNFSLIDGVRNKDIDFFTALFATITQGILLSLIIFLFAIIIWFFLRIVNLTLKRMGIKNERTN